MKTMGMAPSEDQLEVVSNHDDDNLSSLNILLFSRK